MSPKVQSAIEAAALYRSPNTSALYAQMIAQVGSVEALEALPVGLIQIEAEAASEILGGVV